MNAGDVVQLKSGGPSMTVREVEGKDVYCVWFDQKRVLQSERFELTVLRLEQGPTLA
jgi:uncharacterized protein YodC (DUF2158 family)